LKPPESNTMHNTHMTYVTVTVGYWQACGQKWNPYRLITVRKESSICPKADATKWSLRGTDIRYQIKLMYQLEQPAHQLWVTGWLGNTLSHSPLLPYARPILSFPCIFRQSPAPSTQSHSSSPYAPSTLGKPSQQ
jgi:hypothetical protein